MSQALFGKSLACLSFKCLRKPLARQTSLATLHRAVVNAHQQGIIAFRSELGFVLRARRPAHLGHFVGMVASPLDLASKVIGISWCEMKSGAPIRNDFFHRSHSRRNHRHSASERFGSHAPKGLIPFAWKNQKAAELHLCEGLLRV